MISAVIVNHNTSGFLPGLIGSLRTEGVEEILVCDSFSDAGERARVAALPGVRTLLFDDNPGYGAALNRGVQQTRGDLLLLMNADLEALPGSVARLKEALEAYDAAGPNFLWQRETGFLLPHPFRHSWKNELLQLTQPDLFLRIYLAHEWRIWEGREPCSVDLLCGAAFMIRRTSFERLGGFDEGFFLYFEENDFFHRFLDEGMTAAAVPLARFIHFHAPGRTPESDWFYRASKDYFEKKYFPSSYLQLRSSLKALPMDSAIPIPVPPCGIQRKGRSLLYSLFPGFVPAAWIRTDCEVVHPGDMAQSLRVKEGYLALADGHDIVETYRI